jgi:hypothetical protein
MCLGATAMPTRGIMTRRAVAFSKANQGSESTMENLTIIGILAASCLLTGCRSTPTPQTTMPQAASPQAAAATPQSVIDLVRNGYLESNKTTTIGKALAGTFQNGAWKSFATDKGTTVVEFDGSIPFSKFSDGSVSIPDQIINQQICAITETCIALLTKITDNCNSEDGQSEFIKNKIEEVSAKSNARAARFKDQKLLDQDAEWSELRKEESKLMGERTNPSEAKEACMADTMDGHAKDPISFIVQFSINHDGTFQYLANSMGLTQKAFFEKIYN